MKGLGSMVAGRVERGDRFRSALEVEAQRRGEGKRKVKDEFLICSCSRELEVGLRASPSHATPNPCQVSKAIPQQTRPPEG